MDPILSAVGGLGMFLFGMAIMTSGLRKLAGERLHRWLARATKTPLSGAATGAAVTALVQSSSATTVAAVGFVGAGLMTFAQAVGVIFGANIGTTLTGWMVALLGFELKLGVAAFPLLFVASLLYLMKAGRRLRGTGKALAGFALIFMGIGYLQEGLVGARDWIDLGAFDAGGFGGRAVLVLVGVVMTLVTQSSSATVAASLAALNAGVIDLPQAAAAVIGADIGTTATAALATIGGNTGSRRTGFAHVIYNMITGIGAFALLPFYLEAVGTYAPGMVADSPEVVAVAFHTTFNVLGVVIGLPFARPFARLIERMFPERGQAMTAMLDRRLLGEPSAARDALQASVRVIASSTLRFAAGKMRGEEGVDGRVEILQAIAGARDYAVSTGDVSEEHDLDSQLLFECLHLLDHAERVAERAGEQGRAEEALEVDDLREACVALAGEFESLAADLEEAGPLTVEPALERRAAELERDDDHLRGHLISAAARGDIEADALDRALDGARWVRRLAYHGWRMAVYWGAVEARGVPSVAVARRADR